MALVSGSVLDLTAGSMDPLEIEVVFTLNAPNTYAAGSSAGRIIPTEPAVIKPDSSGDFTVNLAVTTAMVNEGWYNLQLRWLGADSGTALIDFPDWQIIVPSAGGNLGDLVVNTAGGGIHNSRVVWVSQTAPPYPRKFMLWLQQEPGESPDPYDPANTGNLYEWR